MYTAEIIRRQQLAGYYRLRQQQEILVEEVLTPIAKLWADEMRRVYPYLFAADGQTPQVRNDER